MNWRLRTYHPTSAWHVPPEHQGQTIEVSYSLDAEAEVILERTTDQSDRSEVIVAYAYPKRRAGSWEPWTRTPRLGRRLHRCSAEGTQL